MTADKRPEFSRAVAVADLTGGEVRVEAGADEREALARRMELVALDGLDATVRLVVEEGGRVVRLRGTLRAEVTQSCVVTLEPVRSRIEAPIERQYVVAEGPGMAAAVDIAPDGEEPPEPLVDGTVDLGEAVAEQLALEIDPFPRIPGATFDGYANGAADAGSGTEPSGPFAALAEIKGLRRDSE
jgi:uncharacterized metal-binding protein YceD (DUF177 family)